MLKKIFSWSLLIIVFFVAVSNRDFLFSGKIPIPADTIVGMYHPFRDQVWDGLTSGVPFKNFLITDAVRQQYPWRFLSISYLREGIFPLWNPYSFSGTPLLANLQSAVFSPFNILFFIFNFPFAWGLQILLQTFLSAVFFYIWLRNQKFSKVPILVGLLSFIYGGFTTAWMQWNTIGQVALWFPIILLSLDKIMYLLAKGSGSIFGPYRKKIFFWILVFVFGEAFSFFAGHLQTFFYTTIFIYLYFGVKTLQLKANVGLLKTQILLFLFSQLCAFLIISIQLFPTLEFIYYSARNFDQPEGFRTDWYLPYKHLIQFIAPDFFGNPSTLNYFGNWNYGEFVGYIGIIPLLFAIMAIIFLHDKKTLFFVFIAAFAILFATPNFLAFLPFNLKLPFISSTAPSRLLFLVDFSLSVLCVFGLEIFLKRKNLREFLTAFLVLGCLFLMVFLQLNNKTVVSEMTNLQIAKRNLLLPLGMFVVSGLFPILYLILSKFTKYQRSKDFGTKLFLVLIVAFSAFDLLRFNQKFSPFVKKDWIFPQTETVSFLQKQDGFFRTASLDSRILPPNFNVYYRLPSVEGYDPLYYLRYAQFWAAVLRDKPDISPFNFNRIITPQRLDNVFMDLLGVKYFLSLSDIKDPNLNLVFKQGETRIYQNKKAFPKAFFVQEVLPEEGLEKEIKKLFVIKNDLYTTAVVESTSGFEKAKKYEISQKAKIIINKYAALSVEIVTDNPNQSFLVLSEINYPGWRVSIDGKKAKLVNTDYLLRGVEIPAGVHKVKYSYLPASFLLGVVSSVLGLVFLLIFGISVWKIKK